MNITFLCDKLNIGRGGSNHSLDLVAGRLAERGHDVSVVTMNFVHENNLPDNPPYSIIEDPVNRNSSPGKAVEIYRKLSMYDDQSDVLHVFNPAMLPIAGHYRNRRGSTPMVGRLNTYDNFCTNLNHMDANCFQNCSVARKFAHNSRPTTEKLPSIPRYTFDTHSMPRLANGIDRFFALSPAVANIYGEIGFDADRIDIVPNCADPSFGSSYHEIESLNTEAETILYVGRLNEQKGVDLLIKALDWIETKTECRIEIVGDGPHREQLEQQAERLGRTKQVQFHGWVEYKSLPGYYKGADVFVHPGRWPEPFGRTIIEAMQCATPVVVSDIGAPPWIIDNRDAVFERSNAADLARTVTNIIDTPSSQITEPYQERLQQFSPERVVSQIETKYREIVTAES